MPTSTKSAVKHKPERDWDSPWRRRLSPSPVRAGATQQVVKAVQYNTTPQCKVVFARAQPARTGACERSPSLARKVLTHYTQANVP